MGEKLNKGVPTHPVTGEVLGIATLRAQEAGIKLIIEQQTATAMQEQSAYDLHREEGELNRGTTDRPRAIYGGQILPDGNDRSTIPFMGQQHSVIEVPGGYAGIEAIEPPIIETALTDTKRLEEVRAQLDQAMQSGNRAIGKTTMGQ